VPFSVIGDVCSDRLAIENTIDLPMSALRDAWVPTLERLVAGVAPVNEQLVEG